MNATLCSRFSLTARTATLLLWCAIAALLVSNVPLFLCTPLTHDATYYDLQVQCIQNGGVLYRDLLEPNLPGVVWIHYAVRAIGGWSPAALRVFDLVMFSGTVYLLCVLGFHGRLRSSIPPLFVLAAFLFYLSTSPWNHCQRDLWMLLPSLGALFLRASTVSSWAGAGAVAKWHIQRSFVEGALWGVAFWIKPHVAIPAAAVILASLMMLNWSRRTLASVASVIAGGMIVGIAGSCWLIANDVWPHFWETQLHWNPEYLAARRYWTWSVEGVEVFNGFPPWSFLHLIAIPCAAYDLVRGWRSRHDVADSTTDASRRRLLLSALYLGWMLQAVVLQQAFSYVQTPGVLLAIALTACRPCAPELVSMRRSFVTTVFAIALVTSPCIDRTRLGCWPACVTRGPTIELGAALQPGDDQGWNNYPGLVEYLQSQSVSDQDVEVYHSRLLSLYLDLGLRPPHRYALPDVHRAFFSSRSLEISETIQRSRYRFVVTDLRTLGVTTADLARLAERSSPNMQLPSMWAQRYPFTLPVLFRSGPFCVHKRL